MSGVSYELLLPLHALGYGPCRASGQQHGGKQRCKPTGRASQQRQHGNYQHRAFIRRDVQEYSHAPPPVPRRRYSVSEPPFPAACVSSCSSALHVLHGLIFRHRTYPGGVCIHGAPVRVQANDEKYGGHRVVPVQGRPEETRAAAFRTYRTLAVREGVKQHVRVARVQPEVHSVDAAQQHEQQQRYACHCRHDELSAPEHCADPGQQFAHGKGLGQVVVRAQVQAQYPVLYFRLCR